MSDEMTKSRFLFLLSLANALVHEHGRDRDEAAALMTRHAAIVAGGLYNPTRSAVVAVALAIELEEAKP